MARNWTDPQRRAIDIRGKNTLISAAAGSGKTAVLVERVIQKITDRENPVRIDNLLIATFTNAAANGMQIKIREAISDRLDKITEDNSAESEYLASQLALLPRASITTVHSFCQNLIRNNFHRLGLAADFEIGDNTRLSILKSQALDEVTAAHDENHTPGFETLIAAFGEKRAENPLDNLITSIYNFAKSTANPNEWLCSAAERFTSYKGLDDWCGSILRLMKSDLTGIISEYETAIVMIEGDPGTEKYLETFYAEHDMLKNLRAICDFGWDETRAMLVGVDFRRLPPKSKEADPSIAEYAKKTRDDVKKQIGKLKGYFSASVEDMRRDNAAMHSVITELCGMVSDFDDAFTVLKRSKNLVDFNDLEHLALKLLRDESVRTELSARFKEILVDEYQDTNGVQEAIFQAVTNGNNLFMVGDVKQSIYGFRNAQPNIFTAKSGLYSAENGGVQINLSHNFRCCNSIVDFVNKIFERIMYAETGGVRYDDTHRLICGRRNNLHPSAAELHIIEKNAEHNDGLTDEEFMYSEMTREAMFTARRIVELVEIEKPHIVEGEETGATRPVRYSDIAILSRKGKGVAAIFSEQLTAFGIPFYCEDDGGNFLASAEIATVLSMLRVIDNPLQDIPLLAVMRSPMFLFSDEELAAIRQNGGGCFYYALKNTDDEKCAGFMRTLERYRRLAPEGIEQLIRTILSDTGYISFAAAMPNGDARMTNLRLLCERAGKFENDGCKSVFSFINYIDAMTDNSSYSTAKILGENDNVVRIMSIHKSKGLEFPVVFLVRCGERFNTTDVNESILYDLNLGLGTDFINLERGIKYPSVSKIAIAQQKLRTLLAEELRILYVALTRAKDLLFVVGSCSNIEKKISVWENATVLPYTVARQNTYLDWLGIALQDELHTAAHIHTANEVILDFKGITLRSDDIPEPGPSREYSDETAARLGYVYPYLGAAHLPSKLPISKAAESDSYVPALKKPDFMQTRDKLSPATRGTIIHFVMQNLDLSQTGSYEDIQGQVIGMARRGLLREDFLEVIDIDAIAAFFQSDIGVRMTTSPQVEREVRFFAEMPAREVFDGLDDNLKDETILLQGVVDCYFIEDDEVVILDYKTGAADRPEYEKQIAFYAKGISKTLNRQVKETLIYPLI